jgi:hypothetical protein
MPDDSCHSLVILARRRGRPPAPVPTAPLSTRLPVDAVDILIRMAARHELSVSAYVREVLLGALPPPPRELL